MMQKIEIILEAIRTELEARNAARDVALQRSRALIRDCANAIRAAHRGDLDEARTQLTTAGEAVRQLKADLEPYPDLYYTGYVQDALKEYVEAQGVYAFMTDGDLPAPSELGVEPAAYLNGLAEAASELRRHALDLMRRNELERAGQILGMMDEVYDRLMTMDFPEAITGGLRRNTDLLRGVVERTRGDLTTAIRQEMMRAALQEFEKKLELEIGSRG